MLLLGADDYSPTVIAQDLLREFRIQFPLISFAGKSWFLDAGHVV